MNEEILNNIFELQNQRIFQNEEISEQIEKVQENKFNYIYGRLNFVKKRLYFLFLKTVIIFMYLFIAIETFITNRKSFTGSTLPYIVETLLLIIGPYAISLFLRVSKENFLTDENKIEIESEYDSYIQLHDIHDEQIQNPLSSLQEEEDCCCLNANSCSEYLKFCDEDYVHVKLKIVPTEINGYEMV